MFQHYGNSRVWQNILVCLPLSVTSQFCSGCFPFRGYLCNGSYFPLQKIPISISHNAKFHFIANFLQSHQIQIFTIKQHQHLLCLCVHSQYCDCKIGRTGLLYQSTDPLETVSLVPLLLLYKQECSTLLFSLVGQHQPLSMDP